MPSREVEILMKKFHIPEEVHLKYLGSNDRATTLPLSQRYHFKDCLLAWADLHLRETNPKDYDPIEGLQLSSLFLGVTGDYLSRLISANLPQESPVVAQPTIQTTLASTSSPSPTITSTLVLTVASSSEEINAQLITILINLDTTVVHAHPSELAKRELVTPSVMRKKMGRITSL
ncbi:hypothetical protein ACH5RR_021682 [Cinchona calisaya]|uniref:Uncharacterized protein n=1 Tax=Cinchona calisaya TaxID=153742 RepID=A0ABD2ZMY8_9GENT